MKYILIFCLFFFQLSTVSAAVDCYNPEYTNKVPQCQTRCTPQDVSDRLPGCFSSGLSAPKIDDVITDERLHESNFRSGILNVVNYFLGFLGLLCVILIVYAGVKLVAEKDVDNAKNTLLYSAVGIIIIILSYSYVNFILGIGSNMGGGELANNTSNNTSTPSQNNTSGNSDSISNGGNIDSESTGPNVSQNLDSLAYLQTKIQDLEALLLKIGTSDAHTQEKLNRVLNGYISESFIQDILSKLSEEGRQRFKEFTNISQEEQEKLRQELLLLYPSDMVEAIMHYLKTGVRLPNEAALEIRAILESLGIPSSVINDIIQRLQDGIPLTSDDKDIIRAGYNNAYSILELEKELAKLYSDMPKTAENMKVYNDLLQILNDIKKDPGNTIKIDVLKERLKQFTNTLQTIPRMYTSIRVTPQSGAAPLIVTLDGNNSRDPNNITIPFNNFHWSYYNEFGNLVELKKGPIIDHTFEKPGVYVVELRTETALTESGYKTALDGIARIRVQVTPAESNLQAYINGRKTETLRKIHINEARKGITFDAFKSVPQIGRTFTEFSWDFGDGGVDVQDSPIPLLHRYNQVGNYNVALSAKDNTGRTYRKYIRIIVEHLSAFIEISPLSGTVQTTFSINAHKSRSSDFLITSHAWSIQDEKGQMLKEGSGETLSFKPQQSGKHFINLVITDAQGNSAENIYELIVDSIPPIATFTTKVGSFSKPSTILFDASGSFDPEQESLTYTWDFYGDGREKKEASSNPLAEYTYQEVGVFSPILTVTDSSGASSTYQRNVYIKSTLDIDFSLSTQTPTKGETVTFTIESQFGEQFLWSVGNTVRKEGKRNIPFTHTFEESGLSLVTLTAINQKGEENRVTKRIHVGDGETPIPLFQIELNGIKQFPIPGICGNEYGVVLTRRDKPRFNGSLSRNMNGNNMLLEYTWDFDDGNFSVQQSPLHQFRETTNDRCYQVKLTVSDRITGKKAVSESLAVRVDNMPPEISRLNIENIRKDNRLTPLPVRLQAQGTRDLDGNIVRYTWFYRSTLDDPKTRKGVVITNSPYSEVVIVQNGLPGDEQEYIFDVEIEDNEGAKSLASDLLGTMIPFEVTNGNIQAPIIELNLDNSQIYMGDTAHFWVDIRDATGKTIRDDVMFHWDFNGDAIFDHETTENNISRMYSVPGEFTVRVRVHYKGMIISKTTQLYVERITRYPLAAFTYQTDGLKFYGDATVSRFDPALSDTNLRLVWDFDAGFDADGDGDPKNDREAEGNIVEHVYDQEGFYTINLSVIDSLGSVDTVSRRIEIRKNRTTQYEVQSSVKRTPRVRSSSHALTTLDMDISTKELKENIPATLNVRVMNANGIPFEDTIQITVKEGDVRLSHDTMKAQNGVATFTIFPLKTGKIIIEALANNTFHQSLTESIQIFIAPNEALETNSRPDLSPNQQNVRTIQNNESERFFGDNP